MPLEAMAVATALLPTEVSRLPAVPRTQLVRLVSFRLSGWLGFPDVGATSHDGGTFARPTLGTLEPNHSSLMRRDRPRQSRDRAAHLVFASSARISQPCEGLCRGRHREGPNPIHLLDTSRAVSRALGHSRRAEALGAGLEGHSLHQSYAGKGAYLVGLQGGTGVPLDRPPPRGPRFLGSSGIWVTPKGNVTFVLPT
jgi:hypothetical protein